MTDKENFYELLPGLRALLGLKWREVLATVDCRGLEEAVSLKMDFDSENYCFSKDGRLIRMTEETMIYGK